MKPNFIKYFLKATEHEGVEMLMMNPQKDSGEYGEEGGMAKSDLKTLIRNAQELHDLISDNEDLPEHVQSKITLASDYIVDAANYIKSEKQNPGSEIPDSVDTEELEMEDD
jgi:hypothetical protein